MNVIIPIGGKGERFKQRFDCPKPFIPVFEREMIQCVLDRLSLRSEDRLFIIYYDLDKEHLIRVTSRYNARLISIHKQTEGAVETLVLGLEQIKQQTNLKKCVLMDCDTFYTIDVLGLYRNQPNNAVFYTHNIDPNPIFSYVCLNSSSEVVQIQEKVKISDCANTGIYCFRDILELEYYAKQVLDKNFRFRGEFYTSCVIHQMIMDGSTFIGIQLDSSNIFNLGTPKQLDEYIERTALLLFDLDGTLIQSDDIYFDVLQQILSEYRIQLTREIFDQYIQGQNDHNALQKLFPLCYKKILPIISAQKDELFCQHIQKLKVIPGAIDFLSKIRDKAHKIAIVTNCNRKVAEAILEYIQINQWIDYLVIGNECTKTKPHPEPYLQAIRYFHSDPSKAIIFEDSKTGLQSAYQVHPRCVVGVATSYPEHKLLKMGAHQTIRDYIDINFNLFNEHTSTSIRVFEQIEWIKRSTRSLDVQKIRVLDEKLKGGFISDVIAVHLETDEQIIECALKLENKTPSFLTQMANELDLYEREYYFYEHLSQFVPVKFPTFYGIIYDDNYQKIGILMQNLNNENYRLNLNLNQEPIDVSLCIIDRLARLHAKFWGKNLTNTFKELRRNNEFSSWPKFVAQRWDLFEEKWTEHLTSEQLQLGQEIVFQFEHIQNHLSTGKLTLCHGDVKSANLFYRIDERASGGYEPYFIDWQYILQGKGVQDLVFFMIESFEPQIMTRYKQLFKDYYYVKLLEYGVHEYSKEEYELDFIMASQCFPFFVAMWFGSLEIEELVDPNFPFFYIQRLFHFYSI
jgi:HAD superfamily hydrolase (TIGR01509 family)